MEEILVQGSLEYSIDLRPASPGIYMVVFESRNESVVRKVVVQYKAGQSDGSFFWYRHFGRINFHVFRAAFHHTVVRYTTWSFGTHSFVHAWRAAKIPVHTLITIFHLYLMLAFWMTWKAVMCPLANATANKTDEKDESYCDKEPRNIDKEFAGELLSEFCKQQGACKNS